VSTGSESQGWAVVTGASSGSGRAFARELARRRYRVLGLVRGDLSATGTLTGGRPASWRSR